MTAQQIAAAHADGQLDAFLGRSVRTRFEGQLPSEHLAGMTPKEIVAALEAAQLDDLLGRPTSSTGSSGPRRS